MCVESQWCVVIQVYILALFICRFLKDWYLSLCQMELLWTTFSNVELEVHRLVPVAARECPLKLNKTWSRGSFFTKPKLCFSLWHARRNSSCSNDGFSATFSWSCRNLTKGPPYLIWQYWLGVLAVYLSVTSQLTVEYRIDRAENA